MPFTHYHHYLSIATSASNLCCCDIIMIFLFCTLLKSMPTGKTNHFLKHSIVHIISFREQERLENHPQTMGRVLEMPVRLLCWIVSVIRLLHWTQHPIALAVFIYCFQSFLWFLDRFHGYTNLHHICCGHSLVCWMVSCHGITWNGPLLTHSLTLPQYQLLSSFKTKIYWTTASFLIMIWALVRCLSGSTRDGWFQG